MKPDVSWSKAMLSSPTNIIHHKVCGTWYDHRSSITDLKRKFVTMGKTPWVEMKFFISMFPYEIIPLGPDTVVLSISVFLRQSWICTMQDLILCDSSLAGDLGSTSSNIFLKMDTPIHSAWLLTHLLKWIYGIYGQPQQTPKAPPRGKAPRRIDQQDVLLVSC